MDVRGRECGRECSEVISAIVFSAGSITSCVRTVIDFIDDNDIYCAELKP